VRPRTYQTNFARAFAMPMIPPGGNTFSCIRECGALSKSRSGITHFYDRFTSSAGGRSREADQRHKQTKNGSG
jgi:hypothetical protein